MARSYKLKMGAGDDFHSHGDGYACAAACEKQC